MQAESSKGRNRQAGFGTGKCRSNLTELAGRNRLRDAGRQWQESRKT